MSANNYIQTMGPLGFDWYNRFIIACGGRQLASLIICQNNNCQKQRRCAWNRVRTDVRRGVFAGPGTSSGLKTGYDCRNFELTG